MKKTIKAVLIVLSLLALTSCTTFKTNYYVDGSYYMSQEAGHFGRPADPVLGENQVFEGWRMAGDEEEYTAWDTQPKGEVRFDAIISEVKHIDFYVNGKLWKSVLENEFANPGIPESGQEGVYFVGWRAHGKTKGNVVTDWTRNEEGVSRYDAVFVSTVRFYLDGRLWASVRADSAFKYPGEPEGKEIPRGYEFVGWVAEDDYKIYDGNWSKAPEAKRFDAVLSKSMVTSGVGLEENKVSLNLERDFEVLGPVTIEERYEIVDGKVKIGGLGYKDLLNAAIDIYPETDMVIDIITDYENIDYTIDAKGEEGSTFPEGEKTLTFEIASYTGLAIDIK